jgi:uncharacterized membrane protein
MDATRIHLFITHLPVFGLFLGFLVLLYGIIRGERHVKIVSLTILLISIVGGLIAFQTGESAEETVESITGVLENTIEQHEESAELTILFFYGLGILSLISLYVELKRKKYSKQLLIIVMAFTVVTFSFVAWTASLGGKIRHTEIGMKNTNQINSLKDEND